MEEVTLSGQSNPGKGTLQDEVCMGGGAGGSRGENCRKEKDKEKVPLILRMNPQKTQAHS